jgi:hypothetical protein
MFVYCTAKLCVCLFLQHEHDEIVFELRRANRTMADQQQPEIQHAIRHLRQRLQRSPEHPDVFGSPWRDLDRTLELGYFAVIVFTARIYFAPLYYACLIKPFESDLLRATLDAKKEQANIHRGICEQADKYLISSANYFRICRNFNNGLLQLDRDSRRRSKADSPPHSPSTERVWRRSSLPPSPPRPRAPSRYDSTSCWRKCGSSAMCLNWLSARGYSRSTGANTGCTACYPECRLYTPF